MLVLVSTLQNDGLRGFGGTAAPHPPDGGPAVLNTAQTLCSNALKMA